MAEAGIPHPITSPWTEKPLTASPDPLHQLPFPFPFCRCFWKLPKSVAPAKLLHPAEAGDHVGHQLKDPHLHSPGTQAGQQHQPLQEPPFLLLSQVSQGHHPAPVGQGHPARPKGDLAPGNTVRGAAPERSVPVGAPGLKQLCHHGWYQWLITVCAGGHCCPLAQLVTTQLPMQGLGHSLPCDQTSVGTHLSPHGTSPIFSPQSISVSYSSPTYRQPWKPSRTWVSCSALKREGCSAAWSQRGDTGDHRQGQVLLGQTPRAQASSAVSMQQHDKTQLAMSRTRVLPASTNGFGVYVAEAHSIYCRILHIHAGWQGRERSELGTWEHTSPTYLGAGSTSWTRGTWQGLWEEKAMTAPHHSPHCSPLPSLAP